MKSYHKSISKPIAAYLVLLIAATFTCVILEPTVTPDTIFYMALVRHDNNPAAVYAEMKRSVSSDRYEELIGASDAPSVPLDDSIYRRDIVANPSDFSQQIPYFSVKPLYIAAAWLLWKIGIPLFAAMHTVSAIAFFLTGWVIWLWLSKYFLGWATFAVATTLVLQPFLVHPARASLPDALGTFLLVTGAYLIWEQNQRAFGTGLLILSILTRPDALIFCVLLFSITRMLISLFTVILVYLTANHLVHAYSWKQLFYHSFVSLVHPFDLRYTVVHVGPKLYLKVLLPNSLHLLTLSSPLILISAIGICVAIIYRSPRYFVLVCLVTIMLHQLAFPIADVFSANRYFAPEYLLIMLVGASTILRDALIQQRGDRGMTSAAVTLPANDVAPS